MMSVVLSGHFDVPASRMAEVSAALEEHIRLTRAEPGCKRFEIAPDPSFPGRFSVSEEFIDRAAFEAHQERISESQWCLVSRDLRRYYHLEDGSC